MNFEFIRAPVRAASQINIERADGGRAYSCVPTISGEPGAALYDLGFLDREQGTARSPRLRSPPIRPAAVIPVAAGRRGPAAWAAAWTLMRPLSDRNRRRRRRPAAPRNPAITVLRLAGATGIAAGQRHYA